MSFSSCCLKTFTWDGTPEGRETKLAGNDSYVTGDAQDAAVLLVHDLFGWRYPNARLLADHYAREAGVTVYLPDFFGGWVVDYALLEQERLDQIDLAGVAAKNSREIRGPEMEACARALKRDHGFKRVGAIGFCYGGWAVCHLGARARNPDGAGGGDRNLVDAISMGHPSWIEESDVAGLAVPTQILAPEVDTYFPDDLKAYAFRTLLGLNLPFDYVHYPGVVHGALVRGSHAVPRERDAMAAAKDSAVAWFRRHLHAG
ncbi:putative dienelactone hydrolase family protein [Rosellinia necatrix]|uniref:Putative dienelactone hydrolase family protein n=1 Tax=Rosellinia necatrix TaxID=77044 RepID=A0A1S7UL02_ROSNE|nr:putative dienelactone hydrolase family protein [Rosellinia necatrix]